MTKEGLDAIRARCNAARAVRRCVEKYHAQTIIYDSIKDIPALLDALVAETKRADEAEKEMSAMKLRGYWIEPDYRMVVHLVENDRDQQKARAEAAELDRDHWEQCARFFQAESDQRGNRAEALERALRQLIEKNEQWCIGCINENDGGICVTPTVCFRGSYWQFDEARFAGGEND